MQIYTQIDVNEHKRLFLKANKKKTDHQINYF